MTIQDRYLFKAKRVDNGEWVMGYYLESGECSFIYVEPEDGTRTIISTHIEVIPSTLCACTGLRAAKSYRGESDMDLLVFENDIVRDDYKPNDVFVGKVIWSKRNLTWDVIDTDVVRHIPLIEFTAEDNTTCKTLEIIGCVHDRSN